jgi:hypothetical protein
MTVFKYDHVHLRSPDPEATAQFPLLASSIAVGAPAQRAPTTIASYIEPPFFLKPLAP